VDEHAQTVQLRHGPPWPLRLLRGLSGSVAAGLCVLAVLLLIVQIVGRSQGVNGPGLVSLLGHLTGSVAAVGAQWFADRRTDWIGYLAAVLVLGCAAVVLWLLWWA
jgi:hypothetical protein